jgi:hypothetical protein
MENYSLVSASKSNDEKLKEYLTYFTSKFLANLKTSIGNVELNMRHYED